MPIHCKCKIGDNSYWVSEESGPENCRTEESSSEEGG